MPRRPPKGRHHYVPKKILERFENIEKYGVYYRILRPGSADPYKLGCIPLESCQEGVVIPEKHYQCYPALVSDLWKENFKKVTCPHCNNTPCPSSSLVLGWLLKLRLGVDRREYRHPGYLNGIKLMHDRQYVNTWLQQKYHDYVLSNSSNSMSSQDGIKYRCLCIEEEIACQFPDRCHSCGFKPCLVHQVGKMLHNYLQGEWAASPDIVKFREMMAGFKNEWEIRKHLRDEGYAKENGDGYRPGWMSDDLFSHGHGPECVDKYARLLFPKVAISRDAHGMYPTGDGSAMEWSPDEGHLYDLDASRVAYTNWLLWCEDADDYSMDGVDDHSYQMERTFFESSDSEESSWVMAALRKKHKRRCTENDRMMKREFINYDTSEDESEDSCVKGGHQARDHGGGIPEAVRVPL